MTDIGSSACHLGERGVSDSVAGKVVVVTGASRGIGSAIVDCFESAGAVVIAHSGRAGEVLGGDFTRRDEQDRFAREVLAQTDHIDVLINNAGTMFGRFPAAELRDEDYDRIVELNQTAPVRITRALLPRIEHTARVRGDASIINTVSISATTGGSPGSSIYSASKAFISTWTRALARELAPSHIRVNAVSPGVIDTDFHARYSSREKLEKTRASIPLQRLGSAQDCAGTFVFLASSACSGYITGQVIEVNGGQG